MTEHLYRGYKITQHASGNGSWVIYDTLGHQVGGAAGFRTAWSAQVYIDELLSH